MTYWKLNKETLEVQELEELITEVEETWLVYDDEWEMLFAKEYYKQLGDKMSADDILAAFEVTSIPLLGNNQNMRFETATTDLVNQISKSKRGGKREGAGSKKGISKSNEHKDKISKSMKGNQNATKSKNS